jgi:hypothetical protein
MKAVLPYQGATACLRETTKTLFPEKTSAWLKLKMLIENGKVEVTEFFITPVLKSLQLER